MSHPLLSALRPDPSTAAVARVTRPVAWAPRPGSEGPDIAVLITACGDVAAATRGYLTVLPRARVFLYGDALLPEDAAAAEAAGATVRRVPPADRSALVRRMFAEVEADIYILAHGAAARDICVAPLIVAEIGDAGRDFVDVGPLDAAAAGDLGDRLLARTVDFLFGRGGTALASDFKACSRRFALSYRGTPPSAGRASALDLALHALRLRMPIGQVTTLGGAPPRPAAPRDVAGWFTLLRLVAGLLVEERPRRVFGLIGLAAVAAGLAVAWPALDVHHWRAVLRPGARAMVAFGLVAAGGSVGVAGALLDSLASARQEVRRLGVAAIPRRAADGPVP